MPWLECGDHFTEVNRGSRCHEQILRRGVAAVCGGGDRESAIRYTRVTPMMLTQ